ncbi:hypothetical protein Droror1_Dr00002368 [Drosera rotundifolia]
MAMLKSRYSTADARLDALASKLSRLKRKQKSGNEVLLISTKLQHVIATVVLESDDGLSAEAMAESGALKALVELLRFHQCEDTVARLLEVMLNNVKIKESKAARVAILPLCHDLLGP